MSAAIPARPRPPPVQAATRRPARRRPGPKRSPPHSFAVYTDAALHQRELERFLSGPLGYVGLEAEIPKPGDFKRTAVGERSVILLRDQDGQVRVVENVCAHRGVQFCRERHGNRSEFVCPYHQWNYDLQGNLIGVPFRRGVKQDGKVNGGMPPDFKPEEHGLTKLAVACRNGVVFASFDHEVEPLEDYLGPDILHYFDRVFDGRELVIHGYSRQRIPQLEADAGEHQGSLSPRPAAHLVRHLRSVARRQPLGTEDGPAFSARRDDLHARPGRQGQRHQRRVELQGTDVAERRPLPGHRARALVERADRRADDAVPQRHHPAAGQFLSTRHIQPVGHDAFDFVWTHFGFAEDSRK